MSTAPNFDRIEQEAGAPVTAEQAALERLREAHAVLSGTVTPDNAREYLAAHEAAVAIAKGEVDGSNS